MFEDWLDILERGEHEVALPTLDIRRGTLHCNGSGWLSWQHDEGLRVRATTNRSPALEEAFGAPCHPGQLIPHDRFVRLTGCTQDEWGVELSPFVLDGFHIHADSPHVTWNHRISSVKLSRPQRRIDSAEQATLHLPASLLQRLDRPPRRIVRALMTPKPRIWPRGTETETRNPNFGRRVSALDCLEVTTSVGKLAARVRADNWFEVALVCNESALATDAFTLLTAIRRAFSFVLGKPVAIRGHEDDAPATETRFLSGQTISVARGSLYAPLGDSASFFGSIEQLLGAAVDFFLTPVGIDVAQYLYLCWDSVDNATQTRMTVASVAAEGLLLLATRDSATLDPGFTDEDRNALSTWLQENEATRSPRFLERIRGLLGTMAHRRPIDVLQDWRRRSLLSVTKEDVDAWQRLRNQTAHARLIAPSGEQAELQVQMNRLRRVENLINRIVLQLMGYRGSYTDYACVGWPTVPFPYVESGTL